MIMRNLFLRAEFRTTKSKVTQWDEQFKKLSTEERRKQAEES